MQGRERRLPKYQGNLLGSFYHRVKNGIHANHQPLASSASKGGGGPGEGPGDAVPLSFFCWAGVGDRELAEETGLARSAYMSSESALRTELLLEEALEAEETLLTLRDLADREKRGGQRLLTPPSSFQRHGELHTACTKEPAPF